MIKGTSRIETTDDLSIDLMLAKINVSGYSIKVRLLYYLERLEQGSHSITNLLLPEVYFLRSLKDSYGSLIHDTIPRCLH